MREPTRGLIALGLFAGVIVLVLAATGPFPELLNALGIPVTAHAGAATALLLVGTLSMPLCWQLFAGTLQALWILRALATSEALLALLAAVFGNWLFIASSYGGILHFAKPVHQTLFEFKRLVALVPLPLATAASFVLWRYGNQVLADRRLRTVVALLLALSTFYLLIAFGLGAMSTRLRTI